MKSFPAYFGLPLQSREIIKSIIDKLLLIAFHEDPFDHLCQKILVMEWDMATSVLKLKNYPDSQCKCEFFKKSGLRMTHFNKKSDHLK